MKIQNETGRQAVESATGELFSTLWPDYDQRLFEESVELFHQRLRLAGFDSSWFQGKRCLDAGCGGGRNAIAMARLGADEVVGVDLGAGGLVDAEQRASDLDSVRFRQASLLDLPFKDDSFDMVWCAGVLMITADENRALDELTRVLAPRGKLYLLVYATGGLRWPLIQLLRPLAAEIGSGPIEDAISRASLPANKRRTFLDDLFCPVLDFYHWPRLRRMLEDRGFTSIERWKVNVRLDHEADLVAYRIDLEALQLLFETGAGTEGEQQELFSRGRDMVNATVGAIRCFEGRVAAGDLSEDEAMDQVVGQGHHRVLATRSS